MDKSIPPHGLPKEVVLNKLQEMKRDDVNFADGRVWSLVYQLDNEHSQFLKEAYNVFFSENGLNPMAFKSLKRMEHDVVQFAAKLLNGGEKAVGTMTSGGTESILLAVKTYRDIFRKSHDGFFKRLGGKSRLPEMILPESAHIAFNKAAHYFDVKIVYAPLDKDKMVDVQEVEKLITPNTMLIVGSAPSYPFGVIDPIAELGALAKQRKIPLHVDACLGGFLLPFIEKTGTKLPPFDFRVEGVTSMSADVHKYGYSAKGASVILYRNMEYLKHQFFVYSDWIGGIFASPALLGTRPGGSIAAAWATLQHFGIETYIKLTNELMQTVNTLQSEIRSIPELEILGTPHAAIFAITSKAENVDIYAIADQMEKKKWFINRQQKPQALNLMVSPVHKNIVNEFIADLKAAVDYVKLHPEAKNEGNAAMYGMMAKLPMKGMINNELIAMMENMYGTEGEMPHFEQDKKDIKTRLATLVIKAKETVDKLKK